MRPTSGRSLVLAGAGMVMLAITTLLPAGSDRIRPLSDPLADATTAAGRDASATVTTPDLVPSRISATPTGIVAASADMLHETPPGGPPAAERAPNDRRARAAYASNIDREFECLALNVYWEARSEPYLGKLAVAQVTLNRAGNPAFPRSICGVVYQGEEQGTHRCQFSWVCDGRSDQPRNQEAWRKARNVAHAALFQNPPDPTNGALWYHATYVSPTWADRRYQVVRIGNHVFYNQVRLKNPERRQTARS